MSELIACHECDLLQRRVRLPPRGSAKCPRCGTALYKDRPDSLNRTLALALGACGSNVSKPALTDVVVDTGGGGWLRVEFEDGHVPGLAFFSMESELAGILGRKVVGARVLDAYAGSGALGLESLSRGAAHVIFVESDRKVARQLERNIEELGLGSRAELRLAEVNAVLSGPAVSRINDSLLDELVVTDTGPGIEPDIRDHLFSPFKTTKEGGTGLGLSISYGLVQKLKGEIRVESKLGEGTRFTILLPENPSDDTGRKEGGKA